MRKTCIWSYALRGQNANFTHVSPNGEVRTWGPSGESLYPVVVCQLFLFATTSFFSLVLADIHIFDLTISKCCCGSRKTPNYYCPNFCLECPLSKCCCGPHEAQYFDVCNNTSTIVTINIVQTPQGFPSKLECPFLVFGNHMHFHSKTQVIICIFGVPTCSCASTFHFLSISYGNAYILLRS